MKRELRDLRRLAVCALLPFIVWIALGFRPGFILFGSDAHSLDWCAFTELARVSGDVSRWTYRATILGGARFYEMIGELPLSFIGDHLSPAHRILFHALIGQTFLGFFGVLGVEALVASWRGDEYELPLRSVPCVSLALAFMPLVGMRYNAGHVSIALAFIAFAAPAALLLIARRGEVPTIVALACGALAIKICVSSGGAFGVQQMVLYSALFGGVVLLPLLRRKSVLPLAALAAGVLLSLPVFAVLFHAARGPDAARVFDGPTLTWSWTIATLHDWSTLITSGTDVLHARADTPWATHEAQVPLGLAIAGLTLVPWKKERGLAWSLGIALLLVVLFSMKIEPIASLLVKLVPPLRLFRVPARAIAPIGVMSTFLAAAALIHFESEGPRERRLIVYLGAVTVLVAVIVLGEIPALLFSFAFAVARPRWSPRWFAPVLLAVASVSSVARLLPPPLSERALEAELARTRQSVTTAHALERALVHRPLPISINQFAAYGFSSPWGFWFPTRRSVEAYARVHGAEVPSTQHAFGPTGGPTAPSTLETAHMYNMTTWADFGDDDRPRIARLPTRGPAWFEDCENGRAIVTATPDGGQRIDLWVSSPGPCVLVVATNVTEGHRATFRGAPVEIVPIEGTLLGVKLPAGEGPLAIDHGVRVPPWTRYGYATGWLLLLGVAIAQVTGMRRTVTSPSPTTSASSRMT